MKQIICLVQYNYDYITTL